MMRNLLIMAALGLMACASGTSRTDTAARRDTVAGPAAVTPGRSMDAPARPETVATAPRPRTVTAGRGAGAVPLTNVPAESLRMAPAAPAPGTDSIRGVVSVVGTSFEKSVTLAERGTRRRIQVTGPLSSLVARLSAVDVSVTGKLSGTRLEAASFLVRSVDGQPAIDGTLRTEGAVTYIVLANGTRVRLAAPPPPFVGREGARVWITGDPEKGVQAFGFIDPAR